MKIALTLSVLFISTLLFSQNNWSKSENQYEFFIENKGQFDDRQHSDSERVEFGLKLGSVFVLFDQQGMTYRFEKHQKIKVEGQESKRQNQSELIHVSFLKSNPNAEIIPSNKVNHSYTFGVKDYSKNTVNSINNLAGFEKITYKNIYPNIDIEYTLHPKGGLKYNFILHPGANPQDIQLSYTTKNKNTGKQSKIKLNDKGQLQISTSLGEIIEKTPFTYYAHSKKEIKSHFIFQNNTLTFKVENYDITKKIIIDPWVISPAFNAGDFTREVETDGVGNIYTIGGELPMVLRKYTPAGALIWQYNTPWDTINGDWLGTLATNDAGVSFITQGTGSEIERISTAGTMDWHQTYSPGGLSTEFWSITFNCDDTKLIVGGTGSVGLLGFRAVVYDIDPVTGNVNGDVTVNTGTSSGGLIATPIEVRSISSSKNAKYIFLTHNDVGAINQNIGACPTDEPVYKVPNINLAYKCENFLSADQNGGGLKAIVANDNFFYVHNGDEIKQYDVFSGALINTVALPGGSAASVFGGGIVVHCSGIDVDATGNVYAGSMDRVVKFDANLNVLSSINTTGGFTVYDVSVSSNGEVIAGGAVLDNSTSTNRGSKIESLNFSTPGKYALVCCDANVCPAGPFCDTDAPQTLIPNTPGGTWSGVGVDAFGNFDPAIAGIGTHIITYTLACGYDEISITVNPCTPLEVCEETNGNLTASLGNGVYTWSTATITTVNTPILSEQDCIDCASTTPQYTFGFYTGCSSSNCSTIDTTWTQYATGITTSPPASYPILVEDGNGMSVIINNQGELLACTTTSCTPPTLTDITTNVTCLGGNDGSIDLTIAGTSTYDVSWSNGAISEDLTNLTAGTYTVTVTDQTDATCTATATIDVLDGTSLPTANLSGTGTICLGSSIDLQINLTGSPNWSFVYAIDGVNQPAVSGITTSPYILTTSTAGTYTLISVNDLSTCPGTVSGTATVTISPTDNASFTTSNFCEGTINNPTITGTIGGTFSFNPIPTDGAVINTSTGEISNGVGGTTYTIQYTSNGVCPDSTTQTVTVLSPDATTQNITVCSGSNYTYPDGTTSTNITSPETNVSTLTNMAGCDSIITTNISIGTSFSTSIDYTICSGSSFTYLDGTTSNNIIANESHVTTIINPLGCDSIFTENLIVEPIYNINETFTVCENTTITYPDGTSETIISNTVHVSNLNTVLGCDSIITTTVTMNPIYTISESVNVCENTNYTYPDGSTEVITGNTIHISNLTTSTGCDSTITTNISMNPIYAITENINLCSGSDYTFPDGSTSINITVNETHVSILSSITGCDSTITTNLQISPSPTADAGNDLIVCDGNTVTLSAINLQGNTASWSNGIQDGVAFTPTSTQYYTLTVTNSTGCTSIDSTLVTVTNSPSILFSGDLLEGCSPLEVNFENLTNGGPFTDCFWDFGDGSTSTECGIVSHTYNNEGFYTVSLSVTIPGGCTATETYTDYIHVQPNPVASFSTQGSEFDILNTEVQFQNQSSNADNYIWNFGDGSPNSFDTNPSHTYSEEDGSYTVTLIANSTSGCSDTTILIIDIQDVLIYFIPNTFTPDGDEFNNIFKPIFTAGYDPFDYSLIIFNRWGEVIFESYDTNYGWDGTFHGKFAQNGVYTWKIEFKETMTDKRHKITGHVNLIR